MINSYIAAYIYQPMRRFKLILSFVLFISLQVFPQSEVSISKPRISYFNDTLVIFFDITNCNDAIFHIEPLITTAGGTVINASGLSGDTGENVSCGINKKIIWSLAEDDIRLNEEIEVQIIAEQLMGNIQEEKKVARAGGDVKEAGESIGDKDKEMTGDTDKESVNVDKDRGSEETVPSDLTAPAYSRANIIASSVILPGLGQKKASRKGAPLLLGVIGYGTLAASGYFFYDYNKKYDQYLEAMTVTESKSLYEDSDKSFKMARNLIYGAAGIWAVNLIWSAVMPSSRSGSFAAAVSANDLYGIQLCASWKF